MAPALEPLLPLVGGEREVREQAGVGAEMGSCVGGAPGIKKVKSEQAFRDNISHFFASTFPWNAERWHPSSQLQRRKEKGREHPFPWAWAAPSRCYRSLLRRGPAEPTRTIEHLAPTPGWKEVHGLGQGEGRREKGGGGKRGVGRESCPKTGSRAFPYPTPLRLLPYTGAKKAGRVTGCHLAGKGGLGQLIHPPPSCLLLKASDL